MAQGLKIPNMPSIEKKELLGLLSKKNIKDKNQIDILLENSKKNNQLNKKNCPFNEILSSFNYLLSLVEEAINFLESSSYLSKLQVINQKIKDCEIYLHTGFDVVIKSVEAEFERSNFLSQKEKIIQFYVTLKSILVESIEILKHTFEK